MCRFLLVRSKEKIKPEMLLNQFAAMCQGSHAPDGDWQGDGFGISWKKDRNWQIVKSLQPIWKEQNVFSQVSDTNILVAHARSAGFPQHKGIIEFNQPYASDSLRFVFNGMIRGVKLTIPLEGKIGAQKIFSLIKKLIKEKSGGDALKEVDTLFLNNAQKVEGMNIGLVHKDRLYALCEYAQNDEYFGLRYYSDSSIAIICSQPIGNFAWKTMKKGEVINL